MKKAHVSLGLYLTSHSVFWLPLGIHKKEKWWKKLSIGSTIQTLTLFLLNFDRYLLEHCWIVHKIVVSFWTLHCFTSLVISQTMTPIDKIFLINNLCNLSQTKQIQTTFETYWNNGPFCVTFIRHLRLKIALFYLVWLCLHRCSAHRSLCIIPCQMKRCAHLLHTQKQIESHLNRHFLDLSSLRGCFRSQG